MNVKPTLEKISPDFGSSILVKKHTEFLKNIKAFWHFHPEIELVYVNKGKGKRHIGNHLSYFNNKLDKAHKPLNLSSNERGSR